MKAPGAEGRDREGPSVLRRVWRLVVGVIGGTMLAVGIAMLVLPGPAFVLIPLGLAILATEFVWARRLLLRVKARLEKRDPQSSGRMKE